LEALKILDLGYNDLENLNTTSLQPLLNLTYLTLKKNKFKVIPVDLFKDLEKLKEVDFSGNPFHCHCDLLPLRDWLRATKVKVKERFDLNITNACVTPYEHKGKQVILSRF
jgi:Leucine-rich repeat (LRR) protein